MDIARPVEVGHRGRELSLSGGNPPYESFDDGFFIPHVPGSKDPDCAGQPGFQVPLILR